MEKDDILKKLRDTISQAESGIDAPAYKNISIPEVAIDDLLKNENTKIEKAKENRAETYAKNGRESRLEKAEKRKERGLRPNAKQSKYPTRANFLTPGMEALNLVLWDSHDESWWSEDRLFAQELYTFGTDPCHRYVLGLPYWGKMGIKNPFENCIVMQDKIRDAIGKNSADYPKWIIINSASSQILDKDILKRLAELKPETHCAGAYGFERVPGNGKFYENVRPEETRGCYIQGDFKSTKWDYIVGNGFKNSDRYKVVCLYGPFIAIRGATFMNIDFSYMASKTKWGKFHYIPDISLEVVRRGYYAATIKTITAQSESLNTWINNPIFQSDQAYFSIKWKDHLPLSLNNS